jgi:hypothetical protein
MIVIYPYHPISFIYPGRCIFIGKITIMHPLFHTDGDIIIYNGCILVYTIYLHHLYWLQPIYPLVI